MKLTCACCQLTDPCIAFPLLLVVSIILSLAYFRGLFGQDKKSMSINVKWGRERLASPFTPLTCLALTALIHSLQIPLPPPDTKLSALRQSLSEHTRLPPNAFKLIYSGAVMKDDNAPRESFSQQKHVTLPFFSPAPPRTPSCFPNKRPPIAFSPAKPSMPPIRDMASHPYPYPSLSNFPSCSTLFS